MCYYLDTLSNSHFIARPRGQEELQIQVKQNNQTAKLGGGQLLPISVGEEVGLTTKEAMAGEKVVQKHSKEETHDDHRKARKSAKRNLRSRLRHKQE